MGYADNARDSRDDTIRASDSAEEQRRKWHANANRMTHDLRSRGEGGNGLGSLPNLEGMFGRAVYRAMHVVPLLGILWLPPNLFRPSSAAGPNALVQRALLLAVFAVLVTLFVQRRRARRSWTPADGGTGRLRVQLFLSGLVTWLVVAFVVPILGLAGTPERTTGLDAGTPWPEVVAVVIGSMLLARLLSRRGVARAVRRGLDGWWQGPDGQWYSSDAEPDPLTPPPMPSTLPPPPMPPSAMPPPPMPPPPA